MSMKKIIGMFVGFLLAGTASANLITHLDEDFDPAVDPSNSTGAVAGFNSWYVDSDTPEGNNTASVNTADGTLRLGFGYDAVDVRIYLDDLWDDTKTYTVSFNWSKSDVADSTDLGFDVYVLKTSAAGVQNGEALDSLTAIGQGLDASSSGTITFELTQSELIDAGLGANDYIGLSFVKGGDKSNKNDVYYIDDVSITSIPEPAAMGLIGLGGFITLVTSRFLRR